MSDDREKLPCRRGGMSQELRLNPCPPGNGTYTFTTVVTRPTRTRSDAGVEPATPLPKPDPVMSSSGSVPSKSSRRTLDTTGIS
jgi:hypothetical protein